VGVVVGVGMGVISIGVVLLFGLFTIKSSNSVLVETEVTPILPEENVESVAVNC